MAASAKTQFTPHTPRCAEPSLDLQENGLADIPYSPRLQGDHECANDPLGLKHSQRLDLQACWDGVDDELVDKLTAR